MIHWLKQMHMILALNITGSLWYSCTHWCGCHMYSGVYECEHHVCLHLPVNIILQTNVLSDLPSALAYV